MNGIFGLVAKLFLLASLVLLIFAGTKAVSRRWGAGSIFLLSGASLSLICYGLAFAGVPALPELGTSADDSALKWYMYGMELRSLLIPFGHLVSSIGVVLLVQRKIS